MVPRELETWTTDTIRVFSVQHIGESLHVQLTLLAHRYDLYRCPFFFADHLPWNNIGMVFHGGNDNLVSGLEEMRDQTTTQPG